MLEFDHWPSSPFSSDPEGKPAIKRMKKDSSERSTGPSKPDEFEVDEDQLESPLFLRLDSVKPDQLPRLGQIARAYGTEEGDRLREEYVMIYGPDPHSPAGWRPSNRIPNPTKVRLPDSYPPADFNLHEQLRIQLYWNVLFFIQGLMPDEEMPMFELLYDPSQQTGGMEAVALFRQELIWKPPFESVSAFNDFLETFVEDLKKPWFEFPRNIPEMSHKDVLELFRREGDTDGVNLVHLHDLCHGPIPDMLYWSNILLYQCRGGY